jgi:STE24 endopeptidase
VLERGAVEGFSAETVERGRRYHRPRYVSQLAEFLAVVATLLVLAFTGAGDALLPDVRSWLQALVYPTIVLAVLDLVQLPFGYWRGYVHEHAWQLSTQTRRGWFVDRVKAFAISAAIATVLFFGFFAIARSVDVWVLVVAPLAALAVVFLTFIAPVVLEPVFNKFEPLRDEELANDLRAVAERAGVPVRDVLVADASRRTTKQNAYVSGFGATRRVVIFDTLLGAANRGELRAVLAHELAHRRYRDVFNFTLIAFAITVGLVVLLWAVLDDPSDPRNVAAILLVLTLAQPLLFPLLAAVSRRWAYRADRFALLTTGDRHGLEQAFRRLVEANVSDVDPPRIVYWLRYSHPTVPERIAALRERARVEGMDRKEVA